MLRPEGNWLLNCLGNFSVHCLSSCKRGETELLDVLF
jgi:hypothetical protein